jgi:peroxiredoxin
VRDGESFQDRRPPLELTLKPLFARKWVQICLLAGLFVIAAVTTVFVIQKFKKTQNTQTTNRQGSTDEIPGLTGGDVVKLPKLPNLKDDYVDLSAPEKKYLLCAFISTDCEGCSQDEPFWKDLLGEIGDKDVKFYLISVDRDRAKVQTFAKTYGFESLPVLFDPQREALSAFKIQFVPQYVLLTTGGKVVRRWNGIRRYNPERKNATEKLDGLPELLSTSASVQ